MTVRVYGIKNCDTVKKALKWLEAYQLQPVLHDYRVEGLTTEWLEQIESQFGWEALVNKRSTTWRNLDDAVKNNLDRTTVLKVLLEQPTLIKRPIILQDGIALIGFDVKQYEQAFGK
ncbi:ArsC protein [Actinobacillus ureae]|uniref:Transcriptional regulator, Spx/MgsR family n=1 Tax=Actinobacillus ureae ATCC 25976 TaxID=887324 RepID=E8KJX6_9PAST|nr:ArsC family reductase [Actinobacillus ureae]EFX90804.1 transcriptional regulator, Spx/MgsR family [Actinobacillus ureae ATCC 25976]SUT87356.1 ArsC protein [Actinobacillus ureae]SUU48689.1 ArsC protein [Actinobacillus ureae]